MHLVLYTWMATLMRTKDRTENVMIFDRDVHMAAKVAALDDPPQVCSLQLTKQKRLDRARSYHHEVTQRVQAGIDQTRLAQCNLWVQFGMPMWVEDEHVGYTGLEVLRHPKQVRFCTALFEKKTARNDVGFFSELPCFFDPDFSCLFF